jgi:hypothetical protein
MAVTGLAPSTGPDCDLSTEKNAWPQIYTGEAVEEKPVLDD